VSNERVLARVEADLAQGHTYVAIQRLTTLVQSNPADLGARSRLGEVHFTAPPLHDNVVAVSARARETKTFP